MYTFNYQLKNNLTGRQASLFNWQLNELPFPIHVKKDDTHILNAKSLIGILSGNFLAKTIITFIVASEDQAIELKQKIQDF